MSTRGSVKLLWFGMNAGDRKVGFIRIPIRIHYTHLTAEAKRPGVI